jgi:hypothetical protein
VVENTVFQASAGAEKFAFGGDEWLDPLGYPSQPEQGRIPNGFRKGVRYCHYCLPNIAICDISLLFKAEMDIFEKRSAQRE